MSYDQIPIGRFSVFTRLSIRALRYYDEKKILVPEVKDGFTGYRYYTGKQIQQGIKIKHLVDLGLGIAEIGRYLEAETVHDVDVISEILGNRLDDAERELLELQRVVSLLKEPLNVVRNQMSNPVVKTVPRQRVLSVREKGSYEFTIGKLVGDLVRVVESPDNVRNFVRITGPFMTVYHDEGYVLDGADIEVCVPVSGRIVLDDPCVEMKNLDSVMVVSVVHKGGYDGMGYSYDRVLEYVQSNGIEITGCIRDVYLNDPNMVDPDDILTEIQIPIKE